MSAKTAQTDDLLAAHTEAVAQRENAKTAGVRAGASRKLALLELELTIQGVEFTPYDPPKPISARKPAFSDDALMARIADVQKVADDPKVPGQIRSTADHLLAKLTAQAQGRGLIASETPDPEVKTAKGRKSKTAADQLADVERRVAA